MDKESENTKITKDDLSFAEEEFAKTNKTLFLHDLAKKIAYKKNASQLSHEVRIYDPYCKYEVEDLIYKEYDELLMVSSKGAEPFKGGVVLKVINKIAYDSFNCEMLEVDFTGGGTFRKHIDYMKKTKTQVLLPSNLEGKAKTPKKLKKEEDPRLSELPMTDKDLKKLEKNLSAALSKSDKFFSWNDNWQLKEKQVEIKEGKIKKIERHLMESKKSASTSDLVAQFFDTQPSDDLFDLCCLSFNNTLEKKHKKNFIFISPVDWGKWLLKKTLDSFLEDLPLSKSGAKLPSFEKEKKVETIETQGFPLKLYLTWREIHSGGLKIPKSIRREFSPAREYIFTDTEGKTDYTVYYYPSSHIFLGLKELYESNNVPQGASLTLEKEGPTHFSFGLKKSKKKFSVPTVTYDPKKDQFAESGEEVFTFSLPNKIIYLEKETLSKLSSLYSERDDLDLRELLILIFKNFGLKGDNLSLHYRRAYHLVDMIKRTTLEEVEKTLLLSPEFAKSEKKKGLFFYKEKIKTEEELSPEERMEIPPDMPREERAEEAAEEVLPEIGTVGEISVTDTMQEVIDEAEEVLEEVKAEAPPAPVKEEIEERPKEEKAPPSRKLKEVKKKREKMKMEVEKRPRRRRGARKIIEERIELEESEMEALIAMKAKEKKVIEEEKVEVRKKEEFKPIEPEKPLSGLFGEKLKSALDKTKKKKKK